ncbi:FG-GAP-like repeat-containing protein [bacterium]|nr:FG-GAP-like repeat-containing protein [bacterium]
MLRLPHSFLAQGEDGISGMQEPIGGTTRTDGIFDQCQLDIGYHYRKFSQVAGVGNINNDLYENDDPKSLLNTADKKVDAKSMTVPDPMSILSTGPKDLVIITENPDGTRSFNTYFSQDCFLELQKDQESPQGIIDAALSDLDGDGSLDLAVLESTGPCFYINDKAGDMTFDSATYKPESHAIEVIDFNKDGVMDVLIASDQGTHIQMADDHLMYSDFQLLNSGNTTDMVMFDFNRDGDTDLVTINTSGIVTFYENQRNNGFVEVGNPGHALNAGELRIMDYNNDGKMDVVVEIAPGVDQMVEVGDAFGNQGLIPSGKRSIQYAMFDHLGTTKILVDDEGDVTWPRPGNETNKLLPFGKDLDFDPVNPDPNEELYKLTFNNKEIDHDLGLHYFGARYYHADLPRFISPDPVSGKLTIPISWNRYLYCRNDPINMIDPDGRRVEPANARLGNQMIQFIERIEKGSGTHNNAFRTLQIALTYNKNDYYLQANGVGILSAIDFKHFLHTALFASVGTEGFGRLAGHFNEMYQGEESSSYYSLEDIPTNNLGSAFGAWFVSGIPLSVQLRVFFQMIGVNMNDQEALGEWKGFIETYNANHSNQSGYDEEDASSHGHGATDASGLPMWEPRDHPDGYAGS